MGALMLTIGVDLAAQDANTGICRVRWDDRDRAAIVELAQRGASDELILAQAAEAVGGGGAVGVDAPFGWPTAFVEAVAAWAGAGAWPLERPAERGARDEQSARLRLRATDHFVTATTRERGSARHPLSVSTDKIGICAMRTAALLSAAAGGAAPLSRVAGPWFEVYPAAARTLWELPTANDKRDRAARTARLERLEAHVGAAGAELVVADQQRAACLDSDDVLDALLCAFVARAAALGRTHPPPDAAHAAAAEREGWIQMPRGELADLFTEPQSRRPARSRG